ncbi:hypothetical protein BDY19DRAFT_906577 [Irpex rosettiformis]|uniref:Uncharacterized protein n=1 Tax=Irpex rosettiformis TaxID=378272 RepID=A0ACB8U2R1_9APHY|nr:hypothetical protein BDY19DRAFT_906577 [Irpex rosettiformis]
MDRSQRIPLLSNELTARIIDFLCHDIGSLKSCSLTCSSFLYPARKYLFYHVHIHIRNCMRFLQFLDTNPSLGVHVRELHIAASNPMEQEETWVDKYLPLLAPNLPNVTHLELKGKVRYKATPFQGFQSVRRLSVIRTEINDLNDFCAFYGMFPLLEVAFFHDIFVYRIQTESVTITAYNPPKALKWTQFNSCRLDPGQYVEWTLKTDMYHHMERIGVCPLQHVGMPPIGSLVAATGPALKHFKLALVGMVGQGGFVEAVRRHFRLDQNTNLQTIEFGSPAQYADLYGSDDIGVSWFPTMLTTIVSTIVEEVVFNLWGGKKDNIDSKKTDESEMTCGSPWDDVVSILSGAPFIGLKKVIFHVTGNRSDAMINLVKERFRRFSDMGILIIDNKEDKDLH